MNALRRFHRRLSGDRAGAAAVEFALAGPLVIMLIMAVLQVGMAMQSYNAIRNVAADTARFAVVQYQRGASPEVGAIEAQARTIATGGAYLLKSDAFTARVEDAAAQRVDGARELTLTVSYTVPAILPFTDWTAVSIDFSRPIFVLA